MSEVSEQAPSHKSISLPGLGEGQVLELLEGVSELLSLKLLSFFEGGLIRVLRGRVDAVDQVRAVLIGCHIVFELLVLILSLVEIASETEVSLTGEGGHPCGKLLGDIEAAGAATKHLHHFYNY